MEEQQQEYSQEYNQGEVPDSVLHKMIDVEETLHKFEMETLRRKRLYIDYKNKKKEWKSISESVKPICNELGISELLGMLRGRATIIARLTKKTDEEIMKDMFQFHRALISLISLRADDWELDEELTKPLLESCIALVQDIVFCARSGFTAVNAKSSYTRHETADVKMNDNEGVQSILGLKIKK